MFLRWEASIICDTFRWRKKRGRNIRKSVYLTQKTEVLSISSLTPQLTLPLCVYHSQWAHTLKPQVFVSVFLIPGTTSFVLIISLQLLVIQPRSRNCSSNPTSFGQLHNPDSLIHHDTFTKCWLHILSPENLLVMWT